MIFLSDFMRYSSEEKIGLIGLSIGQSVHITMAMEHSFAKSRMADFDFLQIMEG